MKERYYLVEDLPGRVLWLVDEMVSQYGMRRSRNVMGVARRSINRKTSEVPV